MVLVYWAKSQRLEHFPSFLNIYVYIIQFYGYFEPEKHEYLFFLFIHLFAWFTHHRTLRWLCTTQSWIYIHTSHGSYIAAYVLIVVRLWDCYIRVRLCDAARRYTTTICTWRNLNLDLLLSSVYHCLFNTSEMNTLFTAIRITRLFV